ncbi:hypothetical protein E5F05_02810 (plasmid) [Deinococcus metallilatus]|uniref:DUF3829 domain-containing protein n=1 Tax=Deinococcus metallilatus TaxID=1211322 RepID=A0AAJ5F669_9DEIO|nr:hypothetical protein [Deinococcus metallilatus]MBB5295667.1 hypothetical protein [Deinococcus metallilatus]QBY06875.1 hypothetical protein E5F05_02810 [Deinococcus metallilatus]TLK32264.1 hypothetical protein FCS05_02145 [Deinococcus metallilatus]GMA14197.1 hypothetical protein GCM10025871_05280 [Deinococcus metallilatus]
MVRPVSLALLSLGLTSAALAAPKDPVKFAVTLEQMRGHYDASLLNYRNGDLAMAAKHAKHPANELYAAVRGDLTPALQKRFTADYALINQTLAAKKPYAEYQKVMNTFSADVDAALATLGATRNDPKFAAQVIAQILENAEHEYEEGVQGGKVTNLAEYQDAIYYVARARMWFDRNARGFPQHQREKTTQAFKDATAVIARKGDVKALEQAVDQAKEELAEISGVQQAAASSNATYFANIDRLLGAAKSHYAGGMGDDAEEALIDAYLDNFEYLEGPLAKKDKALETKLEKTLREDLRTLLKSKPSAQKFSAAVDAALVDLKKARALLGE